MPEQTLQRRKYNKHAARSSSHNLGIRFMDNLKSCVLIQGRQTFSLMVAVFLVLCAVTLRAQDIQQFNGHVVDSTGAVIPHAQVVIKNQSTGAIVKTETNGSGYYASTYLQPDPYTISISAKGFETQQKTDVQLQVDQSITLNFTLKVGTETQIVKVNANAVHVNLTNPDRGEVIGTRRIANLPLDGRNPFGLFSLSPGTHDFSNPIYPRPFDDVTNNQYINGEPHPPQINIGGQTNDAGGDSYNGFQTEPGYVPALDAVKEYKIVLNAYDASYGPPSAIDMSMKSGGHHFHGIADFFMRRQWLDATPWQANYFNPGHAQAPPHFRNQWSLTGTGPLTIPGLFRSHKIFFLVNYAQMTDVLPQQSYRIYSVPNPKWATGDFSGATYWSSKTNSLQPLIIYNPLTPLHPVVDPHDGKTKMEHYPFPGNVIPPSMIDPIGKELIQLMTLVYKDQSSQIVNPGPGFAPWTNNYETLQVAHNFWRNAIIKIDYTPSEVNHFSFQWTGQGRWGKTNNNTGLLSSNPGNMNSNGVQPVSQTGTMIWTHTFNPNLLMNLGATLMTEKNGSRFGNSFSNVYKTLGFSSALYSQLANLHTFPYITTSSLPGSAQNLYLGFTVSGGYFDQHVLGLRPTFTYVHGKHVMRAGIDIRFEQWTDPSGGPSDHYGFTNNFTDAFGPGYSDAPGYYSGSSIASLLLGYMNDGTVYHNLHPFFSQHYFAPWFQDDWHVTPKLTLDLGFRWDFLTPRVERHNQLDGSFNRDVLNPVSAQIPSGTVALGNATQLMGGLNFAGVNGQPRGAFAMNKLDWQPRFGFAYAITNAMSIRGGIGKFYFNDTSHNASDGFSSFTNYTNSLDGGVTPYTATTGLGLSDPYPSVQQPTGASKGYLENLGNGFSFYNPHYILPSMWSYSMTYEVGLTRNDIVSISYVGNITPDDPVSFNINHFAASWDAMCDVERGGNRKYCDNPAYSQIANPFKGVAGFQGTGYYSQNTISKANLTRAYPEFGGITEYGYNNSGSSWYNSLQLTYEHHFTNGIELHATYTHAKALSAGSYFNMNDQTADRVRTRAISTSNSINHSITMSGVMQLPFGRGKLLFSHANRIVDEFINGWQASPLIVFNTGFPWDAGNGSWEWQPGAKSMGISHKILAPDGTHNYSRIQGVTPCVGYKDTDTGAIIPGPTAVAAGCQSLEFVAIPNGYALPRNTVDFGVRQPPDLKFDAALSKSFNLHEAFGKVLPQDTHLELRLDALNVLNHPNWDEGYNGDPYGINWGTISKGPNGPNNPPRYLQLSAKISW